MPIRLVSWNIQWARGMDGRVDPARIVAEARRVADFDILCLQEVADGFDDLAGFDGNDQFAAFAGLLPGFAAIADAPLDLAGGPRGRRRFGNMILSRLPVGPVRRHALPWQGDGVKCMPRGLLDVIVGTAAGPLRVMTTHLEYSSARLRLGQVAAIRDVHRLNQRRAADPPVAGGNTYAPQPHPAATILIGDFNMPPDDAAKTALDAPFADGTAPLLDAWALLHPGAPHPPSMCVYRKDDGPPRALDYAYVTPDLAQRLQSVTVDGLSQASDHQPLAVTLET